VLWLDTDLASRFGLRCEKYGIPAVASVTVGDTTHPVRHGIETGQQLRVRLDWQRACVPRRGPNLHGTGCFFALSHSEGPLGTAASVVFPHGQGFVIFRPREVDTSQEAGRRFEENLLQFSLAAAGKR
jgi:hypothetical protein